ncbi:MAG: sce7726 family protein [Gammaproteobacteria bacterium]|nr:sce7726 family protein [Gammaproteobacteria bacterium]MBU1481509.1 sce7726 family protein [Gammaproteobacteria bacterium]
MQKLTDKEIRLALLVNLGRRANPPRATLEEVHVCNGNAIADVVAVYKTMHCYEIKGETDSINRIVRQSQFYDQAFPRISLVTTENHLRRAETIAPKHWGIVLANSSHNGSVIFRHVRGATRNPLYLPEIALLSLWRSELIKFPSATNASLEKMNKQKIAALIASSAPTSVINESVGRALATRNTSNTTPGNPLPCTQYERRLLASESLKA